MIDWRFVCIIGMMISVAGIGITHSYNDIFGMRFHIAFGLVYLSGYVYNVIKDFGLKK